MTKPFKVVQIRATGGGDGLRPHVLVASDGECWHVLRNHDRPHPTPWLEGDVVELTMRVAAVAGCLKTCLAPDWSAVEAYQPLKYDLAQPFHAILKAWGEERAMEYRRLTKPRPYERRQKVLFTAEDFSGSPQMGSADKATIANEFVRFVERNFHGAYFSTAYLCRPHALLSTSEAAGERQFGCEGSRLSPHVVQYRQQSPCDLQTPRKLQSQRRAKSGCQRSGAARSGHL